MKICPKCAQSFADGFKYCPKDATELVKYDLRARMHSQDDFQFLLRNDSLIERLKNELADAMSELKHNPLRYIKSLIRGEGSSRRRRRLLQAGLAMAVIAYSSIFIVVLLVGLLKLQMSGRSTNAAPPAIPPQHEIIIVPRVVRENAVTAKNSERGLLGGSLKRPQRAQGGGGGNDQTRTSKGSPPLASLNPQQSQPTLDPPKIPDATLLIRPSVYADPKTLLHIKGPVGEWKGQLDTPSLGPGKGTGIGPGNGPGYGPGDGGNSGGSEIRIGGGKTDGDSDAPFATRDSKPTILYKEKAKYTEEARQKRLQGSVVLSALFGADGRIRDIRTIRGLPYGLTENALEAAQKIRFQPAMRQGKPVSVRAVLEFNFALY